MNMTIEPRSITSYVQYRTREQRAIMADRFISKTEKLVLSMSSFIPNKQERFIYSCLLRECIRKDS